MHKGSSGSEKVDSSPMSAVSDDYPCPRSGQALTFDPVFNKIFLFGGRKNKKADGDLNDLWEYNIDQHKW